jgi:hypothetical protein
MISIQIDVTKITKSRLYKGKSGTYLNAILMPTPNGKYGDYMIVESITKVERESGTRGVILGNGKNIHSEPNTQFNEPTDEMPF